MTNGSSNDTTTIFDNIFANIPGSGFITSLLKIIKDVPAELAELLGATGTFNIVSMIQPVFNQLGHIEALVGGDAKKLWDAAAELSFGQIYRLYLDAGLGLDTDTLDGDAKNAYQTVSTMISFAWLTQMVSAAINIIGKAEGASRWSEALGDAFKELPEEMGMTWAMGQQLDRAFDASVGNAMEEWINKQKQANAPEWPLVREMLRQHHLHEDDLDERLQAAGYNPFWRDKLKQLATQYIPVGDVQNLYMQDIITKDDAKDYILQQGFNEKDSARLTELYINKAETEASRVVDSTATELLRSYLIDESTYRTILEDENFPKRQIDDNVKAVKLEHEYGRITSSLGSIKTRFQRGSLSQDGVETELRHLGYSATAAHNLIDAWKLEHVAKNRLLPLAKVLSYYVAGLISADDIKTRLKEYGLSDADMTLLIQHPYLVHSVKPHELTPGLVITAFIDDVVSKTDLPAYFKAANVDTIYIDDYVKIAEFRKAHTRKSSSATLQLTAGDMREAFKYGILNAHDAQSALVAIGYSADDAETLLEITNHGPIQPPQPALFNSLQAALAYLESLGYTIQNPPDPRLEAALGIVYGAGYTPIAPSTP